MGIGLDTEECSADAAGVGAHIGYGDRFGPQGIQGTRSDGRLEHLVPRTKPVSLCMLSVRRDLLADPKWILRERFEDHELTHNDGIARKL